MNVLRTYGWHAGKNLQDKIEEMIEKRCGKRRVTFWEVSHQYILSVTVQIELTRLLPVSQHSMGVGEESEFISLTAAYKIVRLVYCIEEVTAHLMI